MIQKHSAADRTFTAFAHTFILLFTLFCLFPFLLMIAGSFTDEEEPDSTRLYLIPAKIIAGRL